MHNPFPLLTIEILEALIKAGHTYFVRQTYSRGVDHFDDKTKGAFLISYHNNISRANMHFDQLANDNYRFVYNISNHQHLHKLQVAATQPQGYKIYVPLLEKPWQPSSSMKQKVRTYIKEKLQWSPGGNDAVKTDLFTQYGELFLTLKSGKKEVKLPLSEIERL